MCRSGICKNCRQKAVARTTTTVEKRDGNGNSSTVRNQTWINGGSATYEISSLAYNGSMGTLTTVEATCQKTEQKIDIKEPFDTLERLEKERSQEDIDAEIRRLQELRKNFKTRRQIQEEKDDATARINSIRDYLRCKNLSELEINNLFESAKNGEDYNSEGMKRLQEVVSNAQKQIAFSPTHGEFEVVQNDGGGKNACLLLASAGKCSSDDMEKVLELKKDNQMMGTGTDLSIGLMRGTLEKLGMNPDEWYVKFFKGPLNKLEDAGGYTLGTQGKHTMYIHNIENSHFQRLMPIMGKDANTRTKYVI